MKFALPAISMLAAQGDMSEPVISEALVAKVNSMGTTWTAGNAMRFANATRGDVAGLCGSLQDGDADYQGLPQRNDHVYGTISLPGSWDSTTDFPGCEDVIGHVRDQSACGSCWAFGSTEAFNDRRCIAYGDQTFYSAADTTACCSGLKCGLSMGCNGGQPTSAWNFFASTGVVTGGDENTIGNGKTCSPYPFPACAHHVDPSVAYPECPSKDYSTPKCSKTCTDDSFDGDYNSDKVKASSAYTIRGEQAMMEELVTNGPITAAFTVYDDFPTYESGVYQHVTGKSLGGHAIEIVGYGTENGTPYWKIKNSWNPTWGDGGYFKILRGSNECGIEGTVSAGIV